MLFYVNLTRHFIYVFIFVPLDCKWSFTTLGIYMWYKDFYTLYPFSYIHAYTSLSKFFFCYWWLAGQTPCYCSYQFSSVAQSCLTLCDPMDCSMPASLSITNSQSLLKLISTESMMLSNHLILCCPLLLLPSIFPSIRVFSNESVLHIRWPKYWSFSFSICPSNECSGLISFMIDWFDFLAVQGTHRSLLQHHSSKASILWCSAFFMVQLSHPYMTTGKAIALTGWIFVTSHIFLHILNIDHLSAHKNKKE